MTTPATDWRTRYTTCARCGRNIRRSGHARPNQCCADCQWADPDYCRNLMGTVPPTPRPADFEHGLGGYNNHKCRCDTCKQAKAASRPVTHGLSRYNKHGCRCDTCTEANRVHGQQQRTRRTAA